ncbi:CmlA/FloR family chloramphenicol efflux MFS transporter [Labrys sp. KB_33_2]|uniref:CmlA/FloR family chloramphenicol efflux MFS transporter n=1 Tax=unclassified Labrys (in: a-proteobacteria) TaxID=2688601 RepID=UPI003EB7D5E6
MPAKNPVWGYTLPSTLLLMAPFDILASLAMDIYLPIVPIMPVTLATSVSVIQLTLSLYMVMLGVGQIVFGPLSDRIGRRPVLIGGAAVFLFASLGLAASSNATAFVALRFLQAAGASAALVATFATVRDVYAERPEGAVIYSLFSAMLAFVPALGPIAGALIADHFGWRAIFVTLGLLMAAAFVHAAWRWPETRRAVVEGARRPATSVLGSYAFWTYTTGFGTAMGSFFVFFSTAPRVLIDRAGYSPLAFSLAFATAALAMMAATRFVPGRVERWGRLGCLKRAMVTILAGAGLLAAGEIMEAPSWWSFLAPMWVIAVGIVLAGGVAANGALEGFDDIAGAAVALYFCVQSLLVSIGGTLAVLILPGDTAWPLVAYAAGMAGLVLLLAGAKRERLLEADV